MREKVLKTIEKFHMLHYGDYIVVGVSGGVDSTALLHILYCLQQEYALTLHVVHIHHGLREKDADEDAFFVQNLCESWNILCDVFYYDIKEESKRRKMSEEETGRVIRYEKFEEIAKFHDSKIAVAHNSNDQAETILMNLARGAGLKGLTGIAPVRGAIIRPLISCERKEIEQYNKQFQIPFRNDATNDMDFYTRNKIRHFLIPWMQKELNENTVKNLAKTSVLLLEEEVYLEKQTQEAFFCVVEKQASNEIAFNIFKFNQYDIVIKRRMIRKAILFLKSDLKNISFEHISQIISLSEKQSGKKISLPKDICAEIQYKTLSLFLNNIDNTKPYFYNLEIDKTIFIKELGKYVCLSLNEEKKEIKFINICTKVFDYDKININLSLRTRQAGDFIVLSQSSGTKKLKDYFIDEKFPRKQRDKIPLLTQGKEVLWLIGRKTMHSCCVDKNTKNILYVQIWEEVQK